MSISGNPLFDMGTLDEVRRLAEVYGEGPYAVEDLDLLVGTLAEQVPNNRPTAFGFGFGFGFGETMFQIVIPKASRRLQADRLDTDDYNEATYTREGLAWIGGATLKSVLLRHHPELARTGLANVRNAFEPWVPEPRLDPQRHPPRAFNPEVNQDPWLGGAYR